ncbi:MAG: M20/M25/M40 family metallo-hydrolase [Planctomycetes bacterium]|nr:M20/M25/M40 family metallo-hydrolase [Planctomycetota bacterium]
MHYSPMLCPRIAHFRLLFALAAMLAWAPAAISAEKESSAASSERLLGAVEYLASDELEGRGIGTDGLDKAAEYIAEQFRSFGLQTELFDGTPFQKFTVSASPELGPKEQNRLALDGPGGDAPDVPELKLGENFNTLAVGGSARFEAPLVFAGYGITAPEHDYDDYHGLDVKGKVAVILRKEPRQSKGAEEFNGEHPSQHALFATKIENAAKHGAAAIVFVNDHHELVNKLAVERQAWLKATQELAELTKKFSEAGDTSDEAFRKHREEVDKLLETINAHAKNLDAPADALLAFEQAGDDAKHDDLPVFFVKRSVIEPIIRSSLGASLAEIEAKIDEDLQPRSAPLEGWTASGEANVVRRKVEIKNVIAVLEGEGPLADETVVVGAHYDHLGMGGAGSLAPWTRDVHNGADDNASGTAALLEVAHRLASRDTPLPRRVVFMAFTGEERGLLGSAHYVKNPKFPLEDMVAMINMDMVGRLDDDKLVVHGTGTAENFDELVERLNREHGFQIIKKESGYGPSDHTSFYAKGAPVLHLFTGTHRDYHRPSDDTHKINVEGMRRVSDFVKDIVVEIASAPERPKYVKTERPKTAQRGRWPYFGSIPDYASDAEGLALNDVAKDGPAEKAGLKGGDVIVEFGGQKVTGIEDFAAALSGQKAGDKVKVKALRDGNTITVEVTLDPPR